MKRRKLTFRHAPESLMQAIRSMEVFWPCEDLREIGYNASIELIREAAQSDAMRIEFIGDGVVSAAQNLSACAEDHFKVRF